MTQPLIFASTDLAARIESAECDLLLASARSGGMETDAPLVLEVGSGVAIYAGEESPLNKVAGVGFDGPLHPEVLEAVETMYAEAGVPVQVELATLAHASIAPLLTARGYRVVGFENVMGTELPTRLEPAPDVPDLSVEPLMGSTREFEDWLDVLVSGFSAPDDQGVPSHESFEVDAIRRVLGQQARANGMRCYLARRAGDVAGGASMRIGQGVAHLCGAATRVEHRRRGVQRALLHRRLVDAAESGCDLAVVTTLPGSTSQKNVQSSGFELLYARVILLFDPEHRT